MRRQLISDIKQIRSSDQMTPDPVWVEENKQKLIAQMSADRSPVQVPKEDLVAKGLSLFLPARMSMMARPVMTMLLVIVVSVLGWSASVSASYSSLPGDLLYNVKLATEKTHITVAGLVGNDTRETELLSKAAKTRAYEAKALVAQKRYEKVDETVQKSVDTLEKANESVKRVRESKPEAVVNTAGQVSKASGEVKNTINEVLTSINNDREVAEQSVAVDRIVDAKKMATERGLDAVKVVVEAIDDVAKTDEEKILVQKLVIDAIANIEKDVTKDQQVNQVSAEGVVKQAIGETSSASGTIQTSTQTPPLDQHVIKKVEEKAAALELQTKEVAEEVVRTNTALKEEIEQAKQLVESGDLDQAIDKIKNASQTSATLEQKVIQTQKNSEPNKIIEDAKAESLIEQQSISTTPATEATVTATPINGQTVTVPEVSTTPQAVQNQGTSL